MEVLGHTKIMEDGFDTEYYPFFATKLGSSLITIEDHTYPTIFQRGSLQANYVSVGHEGIREDITTQIVSPATICNLAIRSPLSIPILDIIGIFEESVWAGTDDYSDESPLEIKMEPEKEEHYKTLIYKDIYNIYRECSVSDWDGYGAIAIPERAFNEAIQLLDLLPSNLPLPEVSPEPTGEIVFEWYKKKQHVFVISVGGKSTISYAGLFGKYSKTFGAEYFFEELPRIVVDNVLRLFN